jgi:hypothetical protein
MKLLVGALGVLLLGPIILPFWLAWMAWRALTGRR